jgi:isoamyl acetate esterase
MKQQSMMKEMMALMVGFTLFIGASSFPQGKPERIVFFGDSITELGAKPGGFVTLIREAMKNKGSKAEIIGAGVSGNKVSDLLARVDRDVLEQHPTTVFIYIGINDVWHYFLRVGKGTPIDEFDRGLRKLTSMIRQSGSKVILCTPSVIGEQHHPGNPHDDMLDEYADVTRRIAKEMNVPLCDLRKDFIEYENEHNTENIVKGLLTRDGVHLTDEGNKFVAGKMLEMIVP